MLIKNLPAIEIILVVLESIRDHEAILSLMLAHLVHVLVHLHVAHNNHQQVQAKQHKEHHIVSGVIRSVRRIHRTQRRQRHEKQVLGAVARGPGGHILRNELIEKEIRHAQQTTEGHMRHQRELEHVLVEKVASLDRPEHAQVSIQRNGQQDHNLHRDRYLYEEVDEAARARSREM